MEALQVHKEFYRAFGAKDRKAMAAVMHPEAWILVDTDKRFQTEAFLDWALQGEDTWSYEIIDEKLEQHADWALLHYEVYFESANYKLDAAESLVLVPHEGRWVIKHMHLSNKFRK